MGAQLLARAGLGGGSGAGRREMRTGRSPWGVRLSLRRLPGPGGKRGPRWGCRAGHAVPAGPPGRGCGPLEGGEAAEREVTGLRWALPGPSARRAGQRPGAAVPSP